MTFQARSILQSLLDETAFPTADCRACQDLLSAYVDAELNGSDAASAFPTVHEHLAGCTTCGPIYAELKALLALEQSEELVMPPVAATFDFSYLPQPATMPESEPQPSGQPWRLDALGRLIIQFSADLLRTLQGPALQPSYLKGDASRPLTYALTGALDDLDVRINAEPARNDPSGYDVEVEVDLPSRGGWPNLAGSVVTLFVDEGEFDRQETDAFGKTLFEGVPADALATIAVAIET